MVQAASKDDLNFTNTVPNNEEQVFRGVQGDQLKI